MEEGGPAIAVTGTAAWLAAISEVGFVVAAEDEGRGGSRDQWDRSRAIKADFRPYDGRPLSLHNWTSCVLKSASRSVVRRSIDAAIGPL